MNTYQRHSSLSSQGQTASIGRRQWLQTAIAGGFALGTSLTGRFAGATTVPDPLADTWRAASRFGYGLSQGLLVQIQSQGGRAWVMDQLSQAQGASARPIALPVGFAGAVFLHPLPALFDLAQQARERLPVSSTTVPPDANPRRPLQTLVRQTKAWRLASCTNPELEPPLLARLTEFWFNHLNVHIEKGAVRPFVGDYLVNVIRANCLGRFEDLLLASARHPAMLFYLDQTQSVAPRVNAKGERKGLNENYAREVMELHTLGVQGGYNQTDVRELARVLTGWMVDRYQAKGFAFRRGAHDPGQKVVLGQTFWKLGEQEGIQALRMLARHPATAQRISLRLAQFFVADQPPQGLVQRLRQRYLDTQGDLMAVMQALVTAPETWDTHQRLFKTPYDYACSALTATGGADDAESQQRTLGFLSEAGQPLLAWATPDGYAFDQARWLVPEALTRRADYAFTLGRNRPSVDFLLPFLGHASQRTVLDENPRLRTGLILASPEFMWK